MTVIKTHVAILEDIVKFIKVYIRGGTGIIPATESQVSYLGFDTGPGRVCLFEVPITM